MTKLLILTLYILTIKESGELCGATMCNTLPLLLSTIPKETLNVVTGNLLGDGSLRKPYKGKYDKNKVVKGNSLFEMNKGPAAYAQVLELFNQYYKPFCGVGFRENTYFSGSLQQVFTQYHIFTRALPVFTALYFLWYKYDDASGKFIKVVPANIALMFSPLSLAH